MKAFLKLGWRTVALQQDTFGAPAAKPTRLMANTELFADVGVPDIMPSFDDEGVYKGPLQKSARPQAVSVVRERGQKGPFRSEAAAEYPKDMCKLIAAHMWDSINADDLAATQLPSEGVFGELLRKLEQGEWLQEEMKEALPKQDFGQSREGRGTGNENAGVLQRGFPKAS